VLTIYLIALNLMTSALVLGAIVYFVRKMLALREEGKRATRIAPRTEE
jgi:hypothetical protein